ncbi:isopentenyl-diphosphate delta-isomerase [Flavobacteriaceae bacterium MAR_2010_188]|nr:isopentenyl-diphosphate delta-isomerase [Flavobacteriaceae bacterium MAR_2010_188]
MNEEMVILVDTDDNELGIMAKMEAHEKGILHRAFSVFVFNKKGELLLQQRALDKYHSPGQWTNTCCSHQRQGETNLEAGMRRLEEEMGFTTELEDCFSFIYKSPFDNGLTEHEFDHVLVGYYNDAPSINKSEVEDYKWMVLEDVKEDLTKNPSDYTVWFKIIFDKFYELINRDEE